MWDTKKSLGTIIREAEQAAGARRGRRLAIEDVERLMGDLAERRRAGASDQQLQELANAGVMAYFRDRADKDAKRTLEAGKTPLTVGGVQAPAKADAAATGPGGQPLPPSQGYAAILQGYLTGRPQLTDEAFKNPTTGRPDPAAYQAALQEWTAGLAAVQQNLRLAQQLELGIIELPGGVLLDVHDPSVERDPQLQAQMAAFFANQDREVMNHYTGELNALGLQEYAGFTAATNARNDALSKGFQDALARYTTQLATGQAEQDTVVKQVDRQLRGMQEGRARAAQVEDELAAAADFASPDGKTSFSTSDFGGAVEGLAGLGGLGPGQPLLNFAGTRQVDPLGMLAQQDEALGVGGRLPEVPGLGLDRSQIPQAPAYAMPGAPPQLIRPQAPALMPRGGQQQPAPPPDPGLLQLAPFLADRIDQGGG